MYLHIYSPVPNKREAGIAEGREFRHYVWKSLNGGGGGGEILRIRGVRQKIL